MGTPPAAASGRCRRAGRERRPLQRPDAAGTADQSSPGPTTATQARPAHPATAATTAATETPAATDAAPTSRCRTAPRPAAVPARPPGPSTATLGAAPSGTGAVWRPTHGTQARAIRPAPRRRAAAAVGPIPGAPAAATAVGSDSGGPASTAVGSDSDRHAGVRPRATTAIRPTAAVPSAAASSHSRPTRARLAAPPPDPGVARCHRDRGEGRRAEADF